MDRSGRARSIAAECVYDLTLKPMKSGQDVLSLVRAELARVPRTNAVTSSWAYPMDLRFLPDDDRLMPAARKWVASDDPLARCMAVGVFWTHVDPQDTDALKALLQDPFTIDDQWWLSPWSGREYVVRKWAKLALKSRHVVVPPVTVEVARAGVYESVSWWKLGACAAVPLVMYVVVRRWHRRRKGLPRPTWWRSCIAFLTFACVGLALVAAVVWHRSTSTADDVVFARSGFLVEITSVQENLFLEMGHPWLGETPWVHVAITPDPAEPDRAKRHAVFRNRFGTGDLDNIGSLWETYCAKYVPWNWMFDAEFSYQLDTWPWDIGGAVPACHGVLFACAYPYLIAMLLAFPAGRVVLALLTLGWRRWRRVRAARLHLCANCSYDLRAHGLGARCPECGTRKPDVATPGQLLA
jgi:hypothetical protein